MDRRKNHRAPAIWEVRYKSSNPSPGEEKKAVTRDVSRAGFALVLEHQMAPNTTLDLEVQVPQLIDPIRARGMVVWQRGIPGRISPAFVTGVRFLQVDSGIQEKLERYVTKQLGQRSQTADEEAARSFDRGVRTVQQPWPIQMTTLRTTHARIVATGAYLPPTKLTNEDLIKNAGANLQPILLQRALGAVERRALPGEGTAADMIAQAGKLILEQAGCDPKDLDRIICSADPGDAAAPSTAVAVQARLGATCPAYDVTMSCAGWICGIDQGLRALGSGEQRILVLAGCTAGSKVPFRDLRHRAIFGDGAGGLLLESAQPGTPLTTALWTDGRFYSRIFAPYSWSTHPSDIPSEYKGYFYMDPNQNVFFDQLSRVLPPFFKRLLLKAEVTVEDVDHFFLHQPSRPLFEHSLKLLKKVPREKVLNFFPSYGNIVAAELPVMLGESVRNGYIKRGDLICMVTYGAGFTMAGLVVRY